jgi:hypothetical protein
MANEKVLKIPPKFYCEICDHISFQKSHHDKHLLSRKHLGQCQDAPISGEKGQKGAEKSVNFKTNVENCNFHCEYCDYLTCKKSHYNRHLLTNKHLQNTQSVSKIDDTIFTCEKCNKTYRHNSSLLKHIKNCEETFEQNTPDLTLLITELIKTNKELQVSISDIYKNGVVNTINTTNNITNNKTFNLQLFLNETCKDAMNIMDFVNSIQLQLSDLENVGRLGYINGISNIIIDNLNKLEVNKRPLHCTDVKREVMYIKDDNKWERENDDKQKIKKIIKYIANKNWRLISQFKEKYPDCIYSDSAKSDQYNKLVIEALGGIGDNDDEKLDKIVSKIAKKVTIEK